MSHPPAHSLPPGPEQDRPAGSTPHAAAESGEPSDSHKLAWVAQLLDLLPDFFYVHDEDVVFRYANAHTAAYFGFRSRDELLGKTLLDVDPNTAQAKAFTDTCKQIMRDGKPRFSDNVPYVRHDGTKGFLRQHEIPFINPVDGRPMLMGMSRDVTAERELQEQRIRSARLEQELSLARSIQNSLTPAPVHVPAALDVAAFSEPAAYAGGDFYDWGTTRAGSFVCGMGDVTGHGVGPALLAASCRAYARVLLNVFSMPEAFQRLNAQMCLESSDGRFVTFAAVSIDQDTFRVRALSAGHGPCYILRNDGGLDELHVQMPPLGIVPFDAPASTHDTQLRPGDALVLVSDGVYEAHDANGRLLGIPAMRDVLTACKGAPASVIMQRLSAAVHQHASGTPAKDDVTVLIARRRESGQPAT